MKPGPISPRRGDFSASNVKDSVAEALTSIREEFDGMTDKVMGRLLIKGEDAAESYRKGFSDMPLSTFVRAVKEWGERVGDPALAWAGYRLCRLPSLGSSDRNDRSMQKPLLALLLGLSTSLENDEVVDDDELNDSASVIADAGAVIDELRARLALISRKRAE